MNDFTFDTSRGSLQQRHQHTKSSPWLVVIAVLLLLQLAFQIRSHWFTDYRLDRIDSGVRELKYAR